MSGLSASGTSFATTMLSLRIDQFEFEDPGTEEAVEIDVSRQSNFPHSDVRAFVGATVGARAATTLAEPEPFHLVHDRRQISEYVKRFANIDIPLHADWLTYQLETECPDQTHLAICAPGIFIRYHWSTSA